MYTPIDTYTHLYGAVSANGGAGWLPAIHNALFAMRGDCATLLPINAGKADMTELMKCVGAELSGLYFDMPLSARAFELTDENDELAARMGMVDTVSVSRLGARVGHLLLPRALREEMRAAGCAGRQATILGSGALAACAARALLDIDVDVSLAINDAEAERRVCGMLSSEDDFELLLPGKSNLAGECDILINASDDNTLPEDMNISCNMYIALNSRDVTSPIMNSFQAQGAYIVSGFDISARCAELAQNAWGFKPLSRAARMDALGQVRECARTCA